MVGSTGSAYPPPRSGYDELDTTLMPPRSGGEYDRGSPGPMQAGAMSQHFHGPAGDGGKNSNFKISFSNLQTKLKAKSRDVSNPFFFLDLKKVAQWGSE